MASVIKDTLTRPVDASGFAKITAPFPGTDWTEGFTRFFAINFAKMLAPQGRLDGVAYRVAIGMVQEAEDTI